MGQLLSRLDTIGIKCSTGNVALIYRELLREGGAANNIDEQECRSNCIRVSGDQEEEAQRACMFSLTYLKSALKCVQ